MFVHRLPGAICFVLLPAFVEAIACYAPDGSTLASTDFQPCIAVNGIHSMCCGIVRSSNLDTCMPNGLCLNGNKNAYFRDYCTDKTWASPNCLPRETCSYQELGSGFVEMTQCADGSWCCGAKNFTDCCAKNLGFALKAELVTFNAAPVTLSTTATALSTTYLYAGATGLPTISTPIASKEAGITWTDGMVKLMIGVTVGLAILSIVGTVAGFWAGLRRGRGRSGNDYPFLQETAKLSYTQSPDIGAWGAKPLPKKPFSHYKSHEISAWGAKPLPAPGDKLHEIQGQSRAELGS